MPGEGFLVFLRKLPEGAGLSENMAALYIEMTQSLNEEKLMVHEARDAASTTPTTLEQFAQTVFAPAFRAATAGA